MKYFTLPKWALAAAAVFAIAAGAFSSQMLARAQDAAPQSFVVQAGALGVQNSELLAFAPASLQVHSGDTVTWAINGFHNIHFEEAPSELVIVPMVDDQPVPQINPDVAFRTLETGSAYQGGPANSGLPLSPDAVIYSLIIDLEPGTYSYFCDVHPGMAGLINVVDAATPVPSAVEATLQGSTEIISALGAALPVGLELEAQPAEPGQVQVGNGDTGRITINQFFPYVTEIAAGESVTFTIPETSVEPHTVSWPPVRGQDAVPQEVEGGPPILLVGPTLAPMTESGATVAPGDAFSSGLYFPGGSFVLTFSEAGVYAYTCNIHPGMNGVVVVS